MPIAPPPPPVCPAGATCGRVFDEADEGIASATVALGQRRAQLVEVTTDAQSVFVLGPEIPLEDGPIWLDATAPGFVPMLRASRELPLRAEVDRRLRTNTSKRRQLSLYNQGASWYEAIPNMREEPLALLRNAYVEELREHAFLKEIFRVVGGDTSASTPVERLVSTVRRRHPSP